MDIRSVPGSVKGERTLGPFVDFWSDWGSFLPRCNWRDFAIIHVGGEWSQMSGRVEVEVALLGLWLRFAWVYNDSFTKELMRRRDDAIAHPENLIPLDEVLREPPAPPTGEAEHG